MKRSRGRGRRQGNSSNRNYESNGPDLKVRGNAQSIYEKYQYLAQDASDGLHVMELFGGEGGVTKVSIQRHLRTGRNVDIVTGLDLTKEEDVNILLDYIDKHMPKVIIMGPPCTAFAALSRVNRKLHPETWAKSREVGAKLANLAANIA